MPRPGLLDRRLPWSWLLAIAGALLFVPFIGGVHLFDWDEINFAEISREMIATGDYLTIQINFKPFFEKPPLFAWLQVLAMKVFGIHEFAARLPNAIGGILTLILLYRLGRHWMDQRFGVLWALMYLGSILPTLYHKSGIIDPWFNLFIFSGLMAWMKGAQADGAKSAWFFISGVLSGLAILTKGPVGPLLIGLTVLILRVITRDKRYLPLSGIGLFSVGNILIAGTWFGANWLTNGPDFIVAFLRYQVELLTKSVAGHKGFPGYHFVVALLGIFPASLLALGVLFRKNAHASPPQRDLFRMMIVLTAVVLVLFSIVQSKIVHYSSMTYYPVSFLAAWMLVGMLDGTRRLPRWLTALSVTVAVLVAAVIWLLPLVGMNLHQWADRIRLDAFTRQAITAPVTWGPIDFIPALWLTLLLPGAWRLWRKNHHQPAILVLSIGMAIWVNLALIFFIGKVERYTQYAAVEFCASKSGQPVDITPVGYKSYLPYFYAQKPAPRPGEPPREAFYILREDKRKRLADMPLQEIIYTRHGYIFLENKKGED